MVSKILCCNIYTPWVMSEHIELWMSVWPLAQYALVRLSTYFLSHSSVMCSVNGAFMTTDPRYVYYFWHLFLQVYVSENRNLPNVQFINKDSIFKNLRSFHFVATHQEPGKLLQQASSQIVTWYYFLASTCVWDVTCTINISLIVESIASSYLPVENIILYIDSNVILFFSLRYKTLS